MRVWFLALCVGWTCGAIAAAPLQAQDRATAEAACSNKHVVRGLFNGMQPSAALCPVPAPAELLPAKQLEALDRKATHAAEQRQLIDALHALARAALPEPQWGAGFAARIENLLAELKPDRCDQPWELDFSLAHAPVIDPPLSECQCAFEVGSDGSAAHACVRFPQPDGSHPACAAPRLALYDLTDWRAAARAYQFHSLARKALLELQSHCRELIVNRLAEVESHWHHLLSEGYVQYPWELWASRLFSSNYDNYTRCFASDPACTGDEGLDPEGLRLIFLHPGVGLGFPGFGRHDGKPDAQGRLVIALEALGATLYLDDFKQYLGLSAIVGFQDANFARPRVGALVHLSRFLQVGYLIGFVSETRAHGTLYLSVDILGWTNRSLGLVEPKQ